MLAAFGGGMVAGALGIGAFAGRVGRRAALIAGFAGTGLALVAASFVQALPILLAVLAAGGVATGLINPIAFTIMQERVPAATRGRVFGAVLGGVLVAAPIGMIALGSLADAQVGRGPRLLVSGVTFVAIVGSSPFAVSRRTSTRRTPEAAPGG